jgi:hypothetical protein
VILSGIIGGYQQTSLLFGGTPSTLRKVRFPRKKGTYKNYPRSDKAEKKKILSTPKQKITTPKQKVTKVMKISHWLITKILIKKSRFTVIALKVWKCHF